MIRQDIDVNGYWKVTVLYNVPMSELNSGYTKTFMNERRSVVGIGIATSKKEFFNTMAHEVKHLQSHICEYYNVDEDSEEAAYLTGFLMMEMYWFLQNLK